MPSPMVFPYRVVTRAQCRKADTHQSDSLSDSFLMPAFSGEVGFEKEAERVAELSNTPVLGKEGAPCPSPNYDSLLLPVSRKCLGAAQREDPTLQRCFSSVVSVDKAKFEKVSYLVDDGVLLRKWASPFSDWSTVFQIAVPSAYRSQILAVAHYSQWSGHLGIRKTYQHLLKYFYWSGLKSDVAAYCRSCHACQLVGKPKQKVRPAPSNSHHRRAL